MRKGEAVRDLAPGICRRLAATIGLSGLFLTLLGQRLHEVDASLVLRAMDEVGLLPWLGAALASWVSFRAVAGYDLALHRHLATGIAPDRARRAGFAAIAIGQTVGMGVLSGALVRWRMLPELGLAGALRLSLLVALSFLMSWAMLCAGALVLEAGTAQSGLACRGLTCWGLAPWVPGGAGLVALVALVALVWPQPWMPNLITQARLVSLAGVDCLAAGLALWLLLPGDIGFAAFLPTFLLALGAGLLSGAPAGLGAFEISLLALFPQAGETGLLAGVLAWRVVYHALPAAIGAGVALLARADPGVVVRTAVPLPELAEAGLAAQGAFVPHPAGFLAGRTRHGLVALSAVADLAGFRDAAEVEGRWPVLYKAGPRMAVQARTAGMAVLAVAREAWLDPQRFRLDVPARAGLRRKLRKAAAAGVVASPDPRPDWAALGRVNAAWVRAHGGERGFSMGRFDPAYLAGQRVMIARQAGRVVGFATFHRAVLQGEEVWTLDLLRPAPDAPDGTAQALVLAALEAARGAGVGRLSLAAVPVGSDATAGGVVARLGRLCAPAAMTGLLQFKDGFAPRWQRLYIAGPSLLGLALVGREIWGKVHRPLPPANMRRSPAQHEDYEIASERNPWQRGGDRPA